jgi:hypothetical protein
VVAAAGEAARCRGGRRRWRAVGAEVASSAGELLGASYPLEGECNTFAFCKVLLSTIYQAILALICVPLVPICVWCN